MASKLVPAASTKRSEDFRGGRKLEKAEMKTLLLPFLPPSPFLSSSETLVICLCGRWHEEGHPTRNDICLKCHFLLQPTFEYHALGANVSKKEKTPVPLSRTPVLICKIPL
ncbi:UNVERIFIED_CONTAM: hypothetical protein K2H54_014091 [Gekko kuhli]